MLKAPRPPRPGSPEDSAPAHFLRVSDFGFRACHICLLLLTGPFLIPGVAAQDFRSRLKGLVFETEDWSEPKDAWVKDKSLPDKWCLWTTEEDVIHKRSGGQSLKSPDVKADRATPAEGAPPLHTRITGIPAGLYQVWMNSPNRNIALSFDGQAWTKCIPPGGEVDLGLRQIADGSFELWVDDRYATPQSLGSCYYDYIRFEPLTAVEFSRMTAFTLPDGRTQLTWVTNRPLPTGTVAFGIGDARTQAAVSEAKGMRNHAVVLPPLESGRAYTAQIRIGSQPAALILSPVLRFSAGARPVPPLSRAQRLPLSVAEPTAAGRPAWPVTAGVPFALGELASAADVRLLDAAGQPVPVQREVTARWSDGSVRWLLLDFQAATQPGAPTALTLEVRPGSPAAAPGPSLLRQDVNGITLDSGAVRLELSRDAFALFDRVCADRNADGTVDAAELVSGAPVLGNAWLEDGAGKRFGPGKPDLLAVETDGPQRATVRVEGDFVAADGATLFRYRARFTGWRGQRLVRLQWTLGNNRTADEFTPLTAAGVRLPLAGAAGMTACLADGRATPIGAADDLAVLQDYDNHCRTRAQGVETTAARDPGLVVVKTGATVVSAMVRDFWQTYPKGLSVGPAGVELQLLPALPADQYSRPEDRTDTAQIELYYGCRDGKYLVKRGVEITADILVRFDAGELPDAAALAAHLQAPLVAATTPEVYCRSGAFWRVAPRVDAEFPEYWAAFDESFRNLQSSREKLREYGWMNYGDWWGERAWNWGNNEYDLPYMTAISFAQTGRLDLFWRGEQMARHYATVDRVHYPWATPTRELVYAHSIGHVGGPFARNDPRINSKTWSMAGFVGGALDGSGGHSQQAGLMLYGFLTGERRYLETAERACWNQATFYTPNFSFGIERSCGWSLYNAMWAYESTLNPYYLNAAAIYLEKVFELQDPVTGGWRMPQDSEECDCPDKRQHVGGKAFAAGVLLHSLTLYDQVSPDEQVKQTIVRAVDWLLDTSWNEAKLGFRYKTGCPKYQDSGWYTPLVTDGIAYAYEITHTPRYRDFLLRTLPLTVKVRTGAGPGAGKNFTSQFRNLPHTLCAVKSWGVTSLAGLPDTVQIETRRRVHLDANGRGTLQWATRNPGKTAIPCEVRIDAGKTGCQIEPATLRWEAPPGLSTSPDVQVRAALSATGALAVTVSAGKAPTRQDPIALVPELAALAVTGNRIGVIGPAEHLSLKALQACGVAAEVVPDVAAADLTAFRALVLGADVLGNTALKFTESAPRLDAFVRGGGRLVLLQINDEHWDSDLLPLRLWVQDDNGAAGGILDPAQPLFAGVASIKGTVCFDTLRWASPAWTVLAKDDAGGPCVLEARRGQGAVLVIEPSFDRGSGLPGEDVGLPTETCKQVLRNLAVWLGAPLRPG
jgi:hypothetical protein